MKSKIEVLTLIKDKATPKDQKNKTQYGLSEFNLNHSKSQRANSKLALDQIKIMSDITFS